MQRMSLTSASSDDLTLCSGTLRDCTAGSKGRRKVRSGDIAVIDTANLSRREAQFLIDAGPSAVVNVDTFSMSGVPHYGPLMLLDAGIQLIEGAGAEFRASFRDGSKKGRVTTDGRIYNGEKLLSEGRVLTREAAEQTFATSQKGLVKRMETYYDDTISFLHTEGPLLIDGLGIPEIGEDLAGKTVLVLSPHAGLAEQLRSLRHFIREFDPVIIGVESAANTAESAGYRPDVVVGDPAEVDADLLRSGAQVILPADADGSAIGLDRIHDLGVGAMTFPTTVESSTDLALLLADHHGADLIVSAAPSVDLDGVLHDRPEAAPASSLVRQKLGAKLVNARAIERLYTSSSSGAGAWLWAIFGLLVALAAIVAVVGFSGDGSFTQNLIDTWNSIALWFQGLFK
ncbi:putative cytokinetic ring protein SteA [Corynebacterium tapiri]|uniref:Thiamine pyrophosphokinase n=1 Tax=Corynebacterium tapiri TaxID=1448266 RepID=A0A5C4U4Q0_9CORY|nr:putative cytokinetic ring protein SteA [Corynebacterium tapiri]TNL97660.1 thiamine pyrophosphokinase [Corynebacterium tapiri]